MLLEVSSVFDVGKIEKQNYLLKVIEHAIREIAWKLNIDIVDLRENFKWKLRESLRSCN